LRNYFGKATVPAVSIDDLLARAREGLDRVGPTEAASAVEDGAVLIDIRSETQRAEDGVVPEAVYIPRNVLEWRCDPDGEYRDPRVSVTDRPVIVMCDAGYASSLAAATLKELGIEQATDLDGGFQAWREAGLPVKRVDA
jgi:rhodanese-related sulfurtransferase